MEGVSIGESKIKPTISFLEKVIFKSTLVSKLNGNLFLSKDRLTRIKNSIYFNHVEDYLHAVQSSSICLLTLGSDCGVYFVQSSNFNMSLPIRAALKQNRNGASQNGNPYNVAVGSDIGGWWIGRVQKMRRRVGTKWGTSYSRLDLMNRLQGSKGSNGSNA